jgi:hypothetical protein
VFYEAEKKRWSKLAERVGIEKALLFQPQQVDWAKVGRVPLSDFQATDLTGRRVGQCVANRPRISFTYKKRRCQISPTTPLAVSSIADRQLQM